MGEILEDMTRASREKIEKYTAPIGGAEEEENTMNLEEVPENGDWPFIFLAARETHLFQGVADHPFLIFERQEQEEYLSKMKHISGDFNRWITRFEDQIEICETVGVILSEEVMENKIVISIDLV